MSERELKIIADARITLNDNGSTPRWSTERLIELLSDAQELMCKGIPLITLRATINTYSGVSEYTLPLGSVKLLRASSEGSALNITSYDEIERENIDWEDEVSSAYSSIVVNTLSQKVIRPYPKLADGVNKPIKVVYQSVPNRLGWDDTLGDTEYELVISDMWDIGLKQYVIGMAFVDYGDESSLMRSQVAMGLYNSEYSRALKLAKSSFSKRSRTTGYQAPVASNYRGDRNGSCNTRFRY